MTGKQAGSPRPEESIDFPVTFKIGDKGSYTLKQQWIHSERDGIEYDLTCGAGMGSSLIEAWASKDERSVYAIADIRDLASALFDALTERLGRE